MSRLISIIRALKFARLSAIEDHLRAGWMPIAPNAVHHHLEYGIEVAWLCDCTIPVMDQRG